MNRLVTGNLSLVTGDLERLIPSVNLFSVTSYQLPVTSLSGSWSQCAVNKPWRLPMNRRTRSAPGPRAQRVTRTGAVERFEPSAAG